MHHESSENICLRVPLAQPPRLAPASETVACRLERGLVIVDKPAGMTSHDVVDRVRRIVRHKRVGHAGTLDPEVTGVLPIGLGQATRVLHLLLEAGKTYDARMRLHGNVSAGAVAEVVAAQLGTISQLPPVRSRVKRQVRQRTIYEIRITEHEGRDVRFFVRCEAGTYIRKLCHDIGVQLGCGAHMAWLRRLAAGGFTLDDAVPLEKIAEAAQRHRDDENETPALSAMLHVMESALPATLARMWLDDGALKFVANGSPLFAPGVLAYTAGLESDEPVAVQTLDGRLVALAESAMTAQALAEATRGIAARTRRVTWPPPAAAQT